MAEQELEQQAALLRHLAFIPNFGRLGPESNGWVG